MPSGGCGPPRSMSTLAETGPEAGKKPLASVVPAVASDTLQRTPGPVASVSSETRTRSDSSGTPPSPPAKAAKPSIVTTPETSSAVEGIGEAERSEGQHGGADRRRMWGPPVWKSESVGRTERG